MIELKLRDNFKCKCPSNDPVKGECDLYKVDMCNTNCHNYGVCHDCFFFSLNGRNNECFECHFNETTKRNKNIIKRDLKQEHKMVKDVKEKDGYINGNNIKL